MLQSGQGDSLQLSAIGASSTGHDDIWHVWKKSLHMRLGMAMPLHRHVHASCASAAGPYHQTAVVLQTRDNHFVNISHRFVVLPV